MNADWFYCIAGLVVTTFGACLLSHMRKVARFADSVEGMRQDAERTHAELRASIDRLDVEIGRTTKHAAALLNGVAKDVERRIDLVEGAQMRLYGRVGRLEDARPGERG